MAVAIVVELIPDSTRSSGIKLIAVVGVGGNVGDNAGRDGVPGSGVGTTITTDATVTTVGGIVEDDSFAVSASVSAAVSGPIIGTIATNPTLATEPAIRRACLAG